MVLDSDAGEDGNGPGDQADRAREEALADIKEKISNIEKALGLLGLKACSWCKKFVKISVPGALFDSHGEPVCYGCIQPWWLDRRARLSTGDRESMERKLVSWLRRFHEAYTVSHLKKVPKKGEQEPLLTAICLECDGRGTKDGHRCRYCEGVGTVWVFIRQ